MNVTYRIESNAPTLRGWRYLWLKKVDGFNPAVHCARCLVGSYDNRFGLKAPVNQDVELTGYKAGDLLYFCGVASPYVWANNAHLAGRIADGASSSIPLYTGDKLVVHGLEAVAIQAEPAKNRFPGLGAAYLTCRNFQFGVQMFPAVPRQAALL